ncbi:MAG: septum formation family protein [Chloroflexi bacterium]|nr:septum formation family protein [Chloroflexota bacterium]
MIGVIAVVLALNPVAAERLLTPFVPGNVPANELDTGDCFQAAVGEGDGEIFLAVPVVDCAQPHQSEAYSEFAWPGDDLLYPGDDRVIGYGEEECRRRFADFVGLDYESSRLELTYLYPTSQSWRDGDRLFLCAVSAPDGETLEGTARNLGQ